MLVCCGMPIEHAWNKSHFDTKYLNTAETSGHCGKSGKCKFTERIRERSQHGTVTGAFIRECKGDKQNNMDNHLQ